MKIDCLDYRNLPGQNSLFLDFIYRFEKVSEFYSPLPLFSDDRKRRAESTLNAKRFPRAKLIPSLVEFNKRVGAGRETLENIRSLESSDALAVVSGQQVTLFGGPAYSVYKAATAVDLAARLRSEGYNAVPVFWLATDDSDFEEARSTSFFDDRGALYSVRYPESSSRPEQMAGTVQLSAVGRCLDELASRSGKNGFFPEINDLLQAAYQPQRSFREAFAAWMTRLFSDRGLIVFDPLSPDCRGNLGAFFRVAVEKRAQILEDLHQRNRRLEADEYQPQVWFDDTESFLFWVEGVNRFKIKYENGRFQAKGRRSIRFTERELLELVEKKPENIGANVLLRPILQDHLFPTFIYVGGPAEVAYFAQLNSVSRHWGLDTIILPRASFTVVDKKSQRFLNKYGLDVQEVLNGSRADLTEKIVREGRAASVLDEFEELGEDLRGRFDALKIELAQEDPPLVDMLEKAARKIFYQINKVSHRFIVNHEERAPHLKGHLDHLTTRLRPNDHLQERVVNFNQFLAEEGSDFVDRLMTEIRPDCLSHRIWRL